jgi:hypothetical protein
MIETSNTNTKTAAARGPALRTPCFPVMGICKPSPIVCPRALASQGFVPWRLAFIADDTIYCAVWRCVKKSTPA